MNNITNNIIDLNFSFIICCYNSEKYLSKTIDSIIDQDYNKWKIVIVNDGSTDNTEDIINDYIKKGIDIKYTYQKNKGYAEARNTAIKISKYEWITIIDHDDICMPMRLSIHRNEILNNKKCKLFFGNAIYFKNEQDITSRFSLSKERYNFNPINLNLKKIKSTENLLKHGCFIVSSTVTFNKECALKIGGFSNKYKYIADYDFFTKFSMNYDIYCSNNIISKWRIHQNQASENLKKENLIELIIFLYDFYKIKNITLITKLIIFKKHLIFFIKYFLLFFRFSND